MDARIQLREAEEKASFLFSEIEKRRLIQSGKSEKQLNEEIFALARDLFGIEKYWHKRIVRAGENTLHPYDENPPDLQIQEDDILFFDFGPIFEEWEADFGRTYVIGNDPQKRKLQRDIESAWYECAQYFRNHPAITGSELFAFAVKKAADYGWEFGGEIAGHIIGHFPHERLEKEVKDHYVHPANLLPMRDPDQAGNPRHWILEIHFVDRQRKIGGFFEQLMEG